VTLIGTAIVVAALAIYLTTITLILKKVRFTLGTIIAGLGAIEHATQPTGSVVEEINGSLERIASAVREKITAPLTAAKGPDVESAQARIEQLLNPSLPGLPRGSQRRDHEGRPQEVREFAELAGHSKEHLLHRLGNKPSRRARCIRFLSRLPDR